MIPILSFILNPMSRLHFYKYQGTGNDFIMIDNRSLNFPKENKAYIAQLCHRRFGIGADGLILLEEAEAYDFRMVYFNADGGEGSMCGNGGRCTVRFAQFLKIIEEKTYFIAVDGPHHAYLKDQWVYLKMGDVSQIEQLSEDYFLDTGSPHYVQRVDALLEFPVFEHGKAIRNNERFREKGTNVNFMETLAEQEIFVRTYERGVEDETYSCGTGVTACALVAHLEGMASPIAIKTQGGNLAVSFETQESNFKNIYLAGPAEQVFEGHIDLP